MDKTCTLLSSIGYLTADGTFDATHVAESSTLFELAERNKIGALYTTRLRETDCASTLTATVERQQTAFAQFKRSVHRVCDLLEGEDLEFAVVKTPLVFPANFSDIDLLTTEDGLAAIGEIFATAGFPLNAHSPSAIEYQDPETGYLIDIQNNFTLRQVVYLPRDVVLAHSRWDTKDGRTVKVPSPGIEACLFVIHAVSEQLFTLRDFYHLLHLFHQMSDEEWQRFLRTTYRTGLEGAMAAVLPLVATLSDHMFGEVPRQLARTVPQFGNYGEFQRLQANDWVMPHRFGLSSLAGTLYHKLSDPVFRRSLPAQLAELRHPRTVGHCLRQFVERQRRDQY